MKRIVSVALALGLAAPAWAGDAAAGKAKADQVCASCHGPDGNSASADFPRLAGQHADYLANALRQYKTGKRANPLMKGFAVTLSDQDMADLAAYYAAQKGLELKY